jgi:hypothetical protein
MRVTTEQIYDMRKMRKPVYDEFQKFLVKGEQVIIELLVPGHSPTAVEVLRSIEDLNAWQTRYQEAQGKLTDRQPGTDKAVTFHTLSADTTSVIVPSEDVEPIRKAHSSEFLVKNIIVSGNGSESELVVNGASDEIYRTVKTALALQKKIIYDMGGRTDRIDYRDA